MNFPISLESFSGFVEHIVGLSNQKRSFLVCVANVHMFIEAYKHNDFALIIKEANIITPDGQPLIWALRILNGIKQERVSGMDLLPELLSKMSDAGVSAYFYGGTKAMMENAKSYLRTHYPTLKIAGFHIPPFTEHNLAVEEKIIDQINKSSPSIVFVILGCPKQEKWMYQMKDKINTVMVGIGGAFPVMLGMQKRSPKWMQKNGLEWLFRLSREPRRLFKRYWQTNTLFVWIFVQEFIKRKFSDN